MEKIPRDDPRAARRSSNIEVTLDELIEHVSDKHQWVRIRPTRWSPISKGGFPPELFED